VISLAASLTYFSISSGSEIPLHLIAIIVVEGKRRDKRGEQECEHRERGKKDN
jgi:hypothetical protein